MGYVSYIAGLVLGVCVVKGYEILGKKFSKKKGAVISTVLMLLTIVLVHQFDYTLHLMGEYELSFADSFDAVNATVLNGDAPQEYFINFLLLAVFTGIGAWGAISSALSTQKNHVALHVRLANSFNPCLKKLKQNRSFDCFCFLLLSRKVSWFCYNG